MTLNYQTWGKAEAGDEPRLKSLELNSFRLCERLQLELPPGLTLIAGANAQGKTTILEAIAALSTGRLFRTKRDQEAIRHWSVDEGTEIPGEGIASEATVRGIVHPHDTVLGLRIPAGGRKRASLNGMDLPKVSDLLGRLPSIVIAASDLALAQGEPADRRLFLDMELSALFGGYLGAMAGYKRALEHRNGLLRQAQERHVSADEFEPWEAALAKFGSQIRDTRRSYIELLGAAASEAHAMLGGGERLEASCDPCDPAMTELELMEAFANERVRAIARGSTAVGPHRDDLRLDINGKSVRSFGSQGQQRTAVIALKLAAFRVSRETTGSPPLLLLDDMLSDLDQHRRSALAKVVTEEAGQAILTCTDAHAVGQEILRQSTVIGVKAGSACKLDPGSVEPES